MHACTHKKKKKPENVGIIFKHESSRSFPPPPPSRLLHRIEQKGKNWRRSRKIKEVECSVFICKCAVQLYKAGQGRTGHGPTREVQRQRALGRVHGCWALIYRQLQQHIPVSTRGKTVAVAHFSSKRRRGEGRKEGNKTRGGLRTCKTW